MIQRYAQFWIFVKGLELASPPHFVYDFSRELFLMLCSITWSNFVAWWPLLLEILSNMCIVIICCPVCDVINFEIKHSFLIKTFYIHNQKVRTKLEISQELKELLTWNLTWKHFSSFLKGFHWSNFEQIFWKVRVRL